MPAEPAEITRLRNDLSATVAEMSDDSINELFDAAEEKYPSPTYSRGTQYAAVKLAGVRRLIAYYARKVTYQENESRESLSDIVKALKDLEKMFKDDLDEAISDIEDALPPVMWGSPKKVPARKQEFPHDY